MQLVTLRDGLSASTAVGGIVCRDVRYLPPEHGVLFRKGHVLTADDLNRFIAAGGAEVRLLVPEPGDEPETSAAARLAAAVAGDQVDIDRPLHGQSTLRAAQRGLLKVRKSLLRRINQFEAVLVFTAYDSTPVDSGTAIGGTKVAPLLIPRETIDAVVDVCRAHGPLLEVLPFRPMRVALVSTDRLREQVVLQSRTHLAAKLAWFGSSIDCTSMGLPDAPAVASALQSAREAGAQLVLGAGGVTTDPSDPLFEGLRLAGGHVAQLGLPVEPGTACWVGRLGNLPIISLASCELFGRAGAIDLILPRVLAGSAYHARCCKALRMEA